MFLLEEFVVIAFLRFSAELSAFFEAEDLGFFAVAVAAVRQSNSTNSFRIIC